MTGSPYLRRPPPAPGHTHRSLNPGGVHPASSRPNRSPCAASLPLPAMAGKRWGYKEPSSSAPGGVWRTNPRGSAPVGAGQGAGGGLRQGRALFPRRRAWLTEQRIRRRAGGARGTQESHSPARARGAGAGGRRGRRGGERGGCCRLLPHSPGQRRLAGCRRLGLAAGRGARNALLMSLRADGELGAKPGGLRAAPPGSSCPARGLGGRTSWRQRGGRERETVRARSAATRGAGRPGTRRDRAAPPTALCAPRRARSPRNFSACPVPRPRRRELPARCVPRSRRHSPGPRAQLTGRKSSAHRRGGRTGLAAARPCEGGAPGGPAAVAEGGDTRGGGCAPARSAVCEGGGSARPPRPPRGGAAADAARASPAPGLRSQPVT